MADNDHAARPRPALDLRTDGSTYEAPRLERLGTLAELTLGGDSGPDDGYGGAGDEGSL